MALFSYFILIVHFSRRYLASQNMSGSELQIMSYSRSNGTFRAAYDCVALGIVGNNMWGENGVPPAIRMGLAVMVLVLVIEAQRRIPIVLMFFTIIGYYYGGGVAGITWGLENNGLLLITVATSFPF